MSLSRPLITATGGVIAGLGAQKVYLHSFLPAQCVDAIDKQLAEQAIAQVCPPGFNNVGLLLLLAVALVIFYVANNNLIDELFKGTKELIGWERT